MKTRPSLQDHPWQESHSNSLDLIENLNLTRPSLQDRSFDASCPDLSARGGCVSHIGGSGSYSAANTPNFALSNIAGCLAGLLGKEDHFSSSLVATFSSSPADTPLYCSTSGS